MFIKNKTASFDNSLCTGCGTCVSLCSNNALKMHIDHDKGVYFPISNENCINCNMCFNVCPGHDVNFDELNTFIFNKPSDNYVLGNYLNCYVGNSRDQKFREDSSSGGVINQILISLLEENVINGALVTQMKKEIPWQPEPFIARTKEELIESSKSKYCPVPANIAVKEILKSGKDEKFAVVGLPCHIQGIRKAEQQNKLLKEKIILHIGIFCSTGINFKATEYILKQEFKIKKDDLKEITYREGNFPPGYAKLRLTKGSTEKISHVEFWNQIFSWITFFSSSRCILCTDQTNELADISIGSGWFPYQEYKDFNKSVIINRTEKGVEFLNICVDRGELDLKKISEDRVKNLSDLQTLHGFKKNSVMDYLYVRNKLNKVIPNYHRDLPSKVNLRAYLSYFYINSRINLSSKKYLWKLLYTLRNSKFF